MNIDFSREQLDKIVSGLLVARSVECDQHYSELIDYIHGKIADYDRGYTLKPVDKLDSRCRMNKTEFLEDVKNGSICDDDGMGYWGTETEVSSLDAMWDVPETGMEYVYWYSK